MANLEVEISKMMKTMSAKEKAISAAEIKIADLYGDYCRFLGKYVRKRRDLSKQLEVLSREERSGITSADVTYNKGIVSHIDEIIEKKEQYFDKLKDISIQKKSLIEKRNEYADLMINVAKYRKQIVSVGMKIEEAKNKMIPADKVSGTETKLKDLEREFERAKKDLMKKDEQLEKEREEVNVMWTALKDTIKGDME